jgi:streptogramin lyase
MSVSDDEGHIWGHASNGQLVRYAPASGAVDYYTTGQGGQYEARLAWDPIVRKIFFGSYTKPQLYSFNVDTHVVEQHASIPENQLNDIFCGDRSGHIYAAGDSGGNTIFKYDVATNTWSQIPSLPTDHGNNGCCTVWRAGWLFVSTGSNKKWHKIELL